MPRKRLRAFVEELGPDLSWAVLIFAALVYAKALTMKPAPQHAEAPVKSGDPVGQAGPN